MSPRAACRLEALGFEQVYDYVLGIADWKAAGIPIEGDAPNSQRSQEVPLLISGNPSGPRSRQLVFAAL